MAKHVLLFVHGMGEYADGWHKPALDVLSTAFSEYTAFKGKASFTDLVHPVATNYSTLFTKLRAEWKSSVKTIKSTLGKQLEKSDAAEKKKIEARIDGVANEIGAGTDTFIWTHAMDVVLYRFFAELRHATNVSLGKQIKAATTGMNVSHWSVIAHSLGTAVTHNTMHALYTTGLFPKQPPLNTSETRPTVLAMVANVSRVLQLPDLKVFASKVKPGSALLDRVCDTYLNVRHQFDPFVFPHPFKPDPEWPDPVTHNSSQYQHIRPSHLVLKNYKDVHDLDHYLRNPRVHVPIFRGLFDSDLYPEDEFQKACEKFDSGVINRNTNAMRDKLEGLLPAEVASWEALLPVLFDLFKKGSAP